MHSLPLMIYKSLYLPAVRSLSVQTRELGASEKRNGRNLILSVFAITALVPNLVLAATATTVPPITSVFRDKGACTAEKPSKFIASFTKLMSLRYSSNDSGMGEDYVAELSIDGSGIIVAVKDREVRNMGGAGKEMLPIYHTKITPTAGPDLDRVVFEDTNKPDHYAVGSLYVAFKPIGSVSFSANALNSNCPAQTASKP